MRHTIVRVVFVVILAVGLAPVGAQIPDEYTNLKVLPKDIGKRELVEIMKNFSQSLGVRCKFCHVGESETSLEGYDFASDKREHKRVTRSMMQMVGEINGKLVPASGLESPSRVACRTCHRGLESPETLDQVLLSTVEKKGADAAVEQYRSLREEYYGSGSYDFGPQPLQRAAQTLAQEQKDLDAAIALTRLNLEMHPNEAGLHLLLGQLYWSNGDQATALAEVERCLELDPDNGVARRMKQRLELATE